MIVQHTRADTYGRDDQTARYIVRSVHTCSLVHRYLVCGQSFQARGLHIDPSAVCSFPRVDVPNPAVPSSFAEYPLLSL